jgi:DNA-binding transcriptional LysR family regulator
VQQLGIEPHVEVIVESFLSMTHFIAGTQRIGVIQTAIAPLAVRAGGVRVVTLPFTPTPLTNALWWHPVHGRDPEHAWMRELFVEAGRVVDAGAHVADPPLI